MLSFQASPTGTTWKSFNAGVAEKIGALIMPLPDTLSVSDPEPPLLKKTIEDEATPAAVGVNDTPNFMEAPTARVPLAGPTVKEVFDDVTEVMFRLLAENRFVTVTLSTNVEFTMTLPNP